MSPDHHPLRKIGHWAALRATIPISFFNGHCGRTGFGILMYHRVCTPVPGMAPPTWNVLPEQFERQLRYLLQRGFEPWSLHDILRCYQSQQAIPRSAFAVTFDDGYRCIATTAYPILKSLGVPATLFLATGLLNRTGKMPQDDWAGAGAKNVPVESYEALTWDELDVLASDPLIDFGSHTHTHQDFRGRLAEFEEDLSLSADVLRSRWNRCNAPFAFPYGCSQKGFCTAEMSEVVKKAGFSCALTSDTRIIHPESDHRFAWGRVSVTAHDTGRTLAAKLDNWYGAAKSLGRRVLPNR